MNHRFFRGMIVVTKFLASVMFLVGIGFSVLFFSESVPPLMQAQTYQDTSKFEQNFYNNYGVYALNVPEEVFFAGEEVPVELFDVRESLDRELLVNTYWHSQTLFLMKRASRYFPLIEPILKEYGVPDDFKYLAVAESGLENARSPANAVGYWQFLTGTARDYGLEINNEVDERYSIEKSTEAACKFLLQSYKLYNNWTLAAASYNMGRDGISKQMVRQKETDYYDLLLGEETSRYVFRIIALKAIFSNPREYGFNIRQQDLYKPLPYELVEVTGSVPDFAVFAQENGTNYKILKFLNPWLREAYLLNPSGKTYYIKIPRDGARITSAYYSLESPGLFNGFK